MIINCDKHGDVEFVGESDFGDEEAITLYCPECESEARSLATISISLELEVNELDMLEAWSNPQHQRHFEEHQDAFEKMMSKIYAKVYQQTKT